MSEDNSECDADCRLLKLSRNEHCRKQRRFGLNDNESLLEGDYDYGTSLFL